MNIELVKDLTGAILLEAAKYGGKGLPITFLIKFLYLADCFNAEASGGATLMEANWRFLHFGPYSGALASEIDSLEKANFLERIPVEADDDREFDVIKLRSMVRATPLEKLQIPFHARNSLANTIKHFRFNLPGLLNLVYFRTEPMRMAVPGQPLSFSGCQRFRIQDVKQLESKSIPTDKKRRIAELINNMEQRYADGTKIVQFSDAIYDDVYFEATKALDEQLNEKFEVQFEFPKAE